MKLNEQLQLPHAPATEYDRRLAQVLYAVFGQVARKVNAMASGSASALDGGGTAAPTTGAWAQGDTWRNTAPTEQGTAGSKYVVLGWICVTSGEPGTWRQMRALTGN